MYAYNDTVLWSTFVIRERTHKQNKNIIHLLGRVCVFEWVLCEHCSACCIIIYSYIKWNYTTIYAKNKQEQKHTHENWVCVSANRPDNNNNKKKL